MDNQRNMEFKGIGSVFSAIFLWGILPIYWKQLNSISSELILANRIIWSFVFVVLLLLLKGKLKDLFNQLRSGQNSTLFFCGIIISINWLTYIYAVNTNHIIEASLGYYINPLLTIFLARIVLQEKLDTYQVIAVVLAGIGVGIITLSYGSIPIIALILASTFSIYSLFKKRICIEVAVGLTIETLAVLPLAAGYLLFLSLKDQNFYMNLNSIEVLLLLGTGIITAIPLMLFSYGARRIPLTTVGFIQYLAPTISLFLGIYLYKETFTAIHVITFIFIWIALIIYSFSQIKAFARLKRQTISD